MYSTNLSQAANAGDTSITLSSVSGLKAGMSVTLEDGTPNKETVTVDASFARSGTDKSVKLRAGLARAHRSGVPVNAA